MRRALSALGSAVLLLTLAVGTANAAGRPSGQYSFTACWNGTTPVMIQTWSGSSVDGYSFGFGDGLGGGAGFGADLAHPARHGTVASITADSELDVPLDSAFVAGGLTFHGQTVGEGQIDMPTGGWADLPAC